jgi:O-antigen ligase
MYLASINTTSKDGKRGVKLLLLFLVFSFLDQLLVPAYPTIAFVFFIASVLVLMVTAFSGNRNDLFVFLYIVAATRIVIPFTNGREFGLVVPTLFLVISVIRFFPKLMKPRREYFGAFLLCFWLFVIFCLIGIFNNIQWPSLLGASENSGLLNRFNLLNSILIFAAGMILFDHGFVKTFLEYIFRFYVLVFLVAITILLLNVPSFPLFNTFTWSLLVEDVSSKKLVIAGIASSFILIYTLVFVKGSLFRIILITASFSGLLLSGSRISFITGLFMLFIYFVVKRGFLGKSLIIMAMCVSMAYYVLLSPLILLVPEKYQRLVIIFPPEFYTGELAELAESAAASSTSFRIELWTRALTGIEAHPIIGNSFDAPQANYNFEGDILQGFRKIPTEILYHDFLVTGNLHNTFVSVAYILGIPALVFFAYFFLRIIWSHYRKSRKIAFPERGISLFFSIIMINYFIVALVSDLIFNLEFFLLLAMAVKILLFHYKVEGEGHS